MFTTILFIFAVSGICATIAGVMALAAVETYDLVRDLFDRV